MPWTKEKVQSVWEAGVKRDWATLMPHLTDDVTWTISGDSENSLSPLAGTHTKEEVPKVMARLDGVLKAPIEFTLNNIFITGRHCCIEASAKAEGKKTGELRSMYCWIGEFDGDGPESKMSKLRCYLDSAAVNEIIKANQ